MINLSTGTLRFALEHNRRFAIPDRAAPLEVDIDTHPGAIERATRDAALDANDVSADVRSPRLARTLMTLQQACTTTLWEGQAQQDLAAAVESFIHDPGHAEPPAGLGLQPMPAASMQQRAMAVLRACEARLETFVGIACRTGLIVALTVAIRETVAYHVQRAVDAASTDEATAQWACAGVFLVGPILGLLGLVREERNGSANFQSRMGRLCMLGLALGTGIAVLLQGGARSLLPGTVATTVYAMLRDVTNQFVRINDNVQAYSLKGTTAAGVSYGMFGGLFEALSAVMPSAGSTGATGAAQGLQYDLFRTLMSTLPTVGSAILDDHHLRVCNVGNNAPGERTLGARIEFFNATVADVVGALTTGCALRTQAIHAINAAVSIVLYHMAEAEYDGPYQNCIVNGVVGAMMFIIYLPFVFGTLAASKPVKT